MTGSRTRLALAGAVCILASTPAGAHGRASGGWTTYGYSVERAGENTAETKLGGRNAAWLRQAWSTRLGSVLDAQPAFVPSVPRPGGRRTDLVLAGTEHGRFVALRASDGHLIWSRRLGSVTTACEEGTPDRVSGVSSAPTVDRARGRVYAAGGDGRLYALDLATGRSEPHWPAVITAHPRHEHVWGAITAWKRVVYVPIASQCDNPPFFGGILAFSAATGKRVAEWFVTRQLGVVGGGIWGWGGVALDPRDGDVYAATGNSFVAPEDHGFAERLVRLDSRLRVKASNHPALPLSTADRDFGGTPVLFHARGCPAEVAATNKSGYLFLYDRSQIAAGPLQALAVAEPSEFGQHALIGLPAYDHRLRTLYLTTPTDSPDGRYHMGLLAFTLDASCLLAPSWQASLGTGTIMSSPSVANDVVYVSDGAGNRVYAFDAQSGRRLWSSGRALRGPVLVAPTVAGGRLIAASWDGRVHAFAPRRPRR